MLRDKEIGKESLERRKDQIVCVVDETATRNVCCSSGFRMSALGKRRII